MIGYKAFNSDWTCRGFQYEVGKSYELGENETLKICECGFHFCKNPIDVFGYYYYSENTKVAKVEAYGEILQVGTKFVTDKIRIVEEIDRETIAGMINLVSSRNVGVVNTGENNTGNYNSGSSNTGSCNSGRSNTGSYNSGSSNAGSNNNGSYNVGDYNGGSNNVGYHNSGYFNVGNYNDGLRNTGCYNSGYANSGHYNSGDYNTGIFNSNTPKLRMFNKECDVTYSEFISSLTYSFRLLLHDIFNKKLSKEDCKHIVELPNFDPDIFKEITGIDIYEEMRRFKSNGE